MTSHQAVTDQGATKDDTVADRVVVRQTGDGPATWAMGSLFERLVGADESGGALGVSLVTQPPGIATPLHRHTREAEAFYLLEGTMTYRAGEQTYHLVAGTFMYLPKGIPHAFRITGDVPARFVGLTVPGGLLDLYDEVGIPARERRLPGEDGLTMVEEISRWNEVGPRYGLQVVGPPLPEDA
jgi:quercetin dioxygenase-like cupin family protein